MPGQSYQWHPTACAGYLAPVPAVPIDCWLPGDEEQPGGEGLLCDLQAMLQQLRCELKDTVDARLAAHYEDVLRRVLEEPQGLPSALKLKPEDVAPELLAGLESLDFSSATEAADAEGDEAARPQLRRTLGSFESTERSKQQAIRLLPNKHWRPTLTMRSERQERLPAKVRRLLESQCCEFLVGFLILSNVLFLGAEVQVARGSAEGDVPLVFKVAEYSYAAFFSLELLLRILAYGPAYFLRPETQWNLIDFVLVAAFVLEKFIKVFLDVESNLHYLRIIRVARTVRVLRVVRLVAFFRPLRILVYSVMNTLRSLAWTFVLLIIIIYLFAVTFTLAAARGTVPPSPELESFFGSLWTSMALLFKAICGGLDWAVVSDALGGELGYLWSFLFLAYIAFCNLAMLNVVTGVVCHTAIESTRQDQDIVVQSQLAIKQRYVQQLQQLFAEFDPGETGEITLQEFESRISDEELKHYFEVLELTIDEAWSLFKLLDSRGRGIVSLEEFVSGCLKLRGNARSIDMHMLMYQSKWTMDRLACLMESVSELEGIMEGMRPPSRWTTGRLSRGGSRGSMQDVATPTA